MYKVTNVTNISNKPANIAFTTKNKNLEHDNKALNDNTLSTSTKLMIGAGAVATAVIACIALARKGKITNTKPNTKITPETKSPVPNIKPPIQEVKPQKSNADINPTKNNITTQSEKKQKTFKEIGEIKENLYKDAIPLEELKKTVKFENKKAILDGKPFNGNIAIKKDNKTRILLEYKDGFITEASTLRGYRNLSEIKKYNKGQINEIEYRNNEFDRYSRDKDGNRIITTNWTKTALSDEQTFTTTISAEDGKVIENINHPNDNFFLNDKFIYSKNNQIREYVKPKSPNIIYREVKDNKTGKITLTADTITLKTK